MNVKARWGCEALEVWNCGKMTDGDMELWRYGNMNGDMKIWRYGHMGV